MSAIDMPSRILVVKLSSLGDVVRVTPCLRALRAWRPDAEIAMVVDRTYEPLVRHDPNLSEILLNESGGFWAALRSARSIRAERRQTPFDLAIDFQGTRRSLAWMYGLGARVRAGRGRWRPGWQTLVPERLEINDVADQARILEEMGVPVRDLRPVLQVDRDADARLANRLQQLGLPSRGFLLLNPFSRWRSKMWPIERYVEVVRWFWKTHAQPVVLTGSAAELAEAKSLVRAAPKDSVVSLAGELPLAEAMALFQRAAVMLTGDSGPMHAAAALGVRVVALFGPTWPERSAPWGEGHRVIQRSRPRHHRDYRSAAAQSHMLAIDVDTVCAAVSDAWSNLPPVTAP